MSGVALVGGINACATAERPSIPFDMCRVALGEAAAAGVDGGSAKKKSKKGAAEGAAAGTQVGALLQQLERLAKGKGTKSSAWAAAVEAACDSIAALAAGLGSDGGSGTKKRKHHPHGDAAAATAGDLAAVQRQAELLAQLPLSSLQSEAATAMAALAVGSLLCCWEGSLACLQAACDTKQLVRSALRTSTACLQLLARLAGGSSGRSLCSKRQELPAVLRAALMAAHGAAGLWSDASVLAQVSLAAEHSSSVMQAAFAAHLAALNGSGLQQMAQQLGQQLEQQQGPQQWAAAVLAQACLAASYAAVQAGSSSSDRAASAILCGTAALEGQQEQQQAAASLIGGTVAALEAAVAAALPGALSAAAAEGSGEQQALLAASLYRSAALVLRLRCSDHPAADALEQQAGGGSGKASSVSTMAAGLQACAALLSPPGAGGTAAAAVLAPAALDYLAACCVVTGHMRPAASNRHYSSLLALLLRLLAQEPVATAIPPSRQTIPFAAAFPAAAAAVAAQASGAGGAARRPLLLGALRELVAGSSSQHLLLPLRFVEAALPSAAAGSGRRSSALALPLCELTLVLLEASGGNRQQRLLGQHCERIAALLSGFVSTTAHARGRAALKQQQLQQQQVPSLQQLAAAILAAGEGGSLETPAAAEASALLPEPAAAAEVAALCTALRALESLAARPKLFPLPAAAICSTLSCIAVVWTAYAEAAPGEQLEPGAAALPGFRFLLSTASGAGLFGGSCHLLMAMLRHRQQVRAVLRGPASSSAKSHTPASCLPHGACQPSPNQCLPAIPPLVNTQELRRCLPLVLQTLRSLLRFLVAADLSARLQEQLGSVAAGAAAGGQQQQQERRLRVKCTELLAAVLSQLTELKVRHCFFFFFNACRVCMVRGLVRDRRGLLAFSCP